MESSNYKSSENKKLKLDSVISTLFEDPVLSDVSKKPSLSDVDTLINLELGSAMKLTIVKMDNTSFDIALLNSATIKDLKVGIMKKVNETQQTNMGHSHISWRHVWSNYCMTHNGEKLLDDNCMLSSYAIRNNSKLQFSPHVASRLGEKKSRRRKHRFFHGLSRKS